MVMLIRLGRRGDNRRGEFLIFFHSSRQNVTAKYPFAPFIGRPDGGISHTCQITANNKLYRKYGTFLSNRDVRVWHGENMIWHNAGLLT